MRHELFAWVLFVTLWNENENIMHWIEVCVYVPRVPRIQKKEWTLQECIRLMRPTMQKDGYNGIVLDSSSCSCSISWWHS